jgi:hypothetical protein
LAITADVFARILERFFYFLERRHEHGLLVFDQFEKNSDQRFVRQMERYFTKTKSGRCRASMIVPAPLFVASDMTLPVQAADLAIYCANRGFRRVADLAFQKCTRNSAS